MAQQDKLEHEKVQHSMIQYRTVKYNTTNDTIVYYSMRKSGIA